MKTVIISDTHQKHHELDIPAGDMIIHCGDFSHTKQSIGRFIDWYGSLDFKYKILIAGNHEVHLNKYGDFKSFCLEQEIHYLEDSSIEIEGFKIHGSPYTPLFRNWAYMKEDGYLVEHWKKIPLDTDILITHGPQYAVLDRVMIHGVPEHVGSRSLSRRILELKNLKYHFFGHIHSEAGIKEKDEFKEYLSINACSLNDSPTTGRYSMREPLVIDI